MWFLRSGSCFALAAVLWLCAPAAMAEFYSGKTLNVMVNYAAGGTTDVAGRVVARHIARYLEDDPTVIVTNRPGAGGLVGISWLGSGAAKPDGLTVCFCVLNVVAPVINHPALRTTYDKFVYIGGVAEANLAYGRRDIPPGMKSARDLVKADEVFAGGYNPTAVQDIRVKVALQLLGVKYQMVSGFGGANKVLLAITQKEVSFAATSVSGYVRAVMPNLVKSGVAMPFFYFPISKAGGGFYPVKEIEELGIPGFHDFYKEVHGKPPSGPLWETLVLINDLGATMLRAMFMQKDVPEEAVSELRSAFSKLATDQAFLEEYTRINGLPPDMVDADRGTEVMKRLNNMPPETVTMLKKMVSK